MVKEEKVVAVVDPTSAAGETELMNEVSEIERFADSIVVENDDDFLKAGEFGVLLKTKMAEVTEFFAPMKSAAHAAHKQICDREKQMLRPLKNAETTVKNTLGKYTHEKMLAQKAAEEEARRLAQEEAEKRLEEAVKAEQLGDHDKAQFALLDAEIAEMESKSIVVQSEDRKVKGVSVQKEWEITSIDGGCYEAYSVLKRGD